MSPSKSDQRIPEERRQSFRCPVGGPRRQGRLRIGRREIAVRIVDESAGGFAVESDEDPGCQVGDTLALEIALNWVEVRVVEVERQESTPEDPQDIVDPTPTRLNLLRIRDVDEREVYPLLSWRRFRSALMPQVPLGRSFKSTMAMIVVMVAAGIVFVWLLNELVPLFNAM